MSRIVLIMNYSENERHFLSSLGARIRDARKMKGLSQEELAFQAGLDRTYISAVERGRRNIAVINLAKIARALGTTCAVLLQEMGLEH